ncbi:hypothetical protein AB7M41_002371 [Bradyrhizobium diazoefficiens]
MRNGAAGVPATHIAVIANEPALLDIRSLGMIHRNLKRFVTIFAPMLIDSNRLTNVSANVRAHDVVKQILRAAESSDLAPWQVGVANGVPNSKKLYLGSNGPFQKSSFGM